MTLSALAKATKFINDVLGLVTALYWTPRNWWMKRKLQGRVRHVARIASRGIGGFQDPNISAVFVEPANVVEIQVDPQKTKYDIVQVNRDSELLLMQSSLQTLRDQFEDLKEYLPLVAVNALEFVLLYSSLIEVSPKAARRAREAIADYQKNKPVEIWYNRLEELHNRGNIAGMIIPHLNDVHDKIPVPNTKVRRECVKYIGWVCKTMDEIQNPELKITKTKTGHAKIAKRRIATMPTFQSAALAKKITIVPMGDLDWSKYGAVGVSCAKAEFQRIILVAFGPFHGEKALQASTMITSAYPTFSVSRLVMTSRGGTGRVLALYVYVDQNANSDDEMKLRQMWNQASVLDISSNKLTFELARTGWFIIRHSGGDFQAFLSTLFDVISDTDARITECSLWREGAELRTILRISRLR